LVEPRQCGNRILGVVIDAQGQWRVVGVQNKQSRRPQAAKIPAGVAGGVQTRQQSFGQPRVRRAERHNHRGQYFWSAQHVSRRDPAREGEAAFRVLVRRAGKCGRVPMQVKRRNLPVIAPPVAGCHVLDRAAWVDSGAHLLQHVFAPEGRGRRALAGGHARRQIATQHPATDTKAAGRRGAPDGVCFQATCENRKCHASPYRVPRQLS